MKLPRKQFNIGGWWGNLLLAMTQISPLVALFTLTFAGIGAYPVVKEWVLDFGFDMKFWQFVFVIILGIGIGLFAAWLFGLASFFTQWNKQFWQHNNPMKEKLDLLLKEVQELKAKQ